MKKLILFLFVIAPSLIFSQNRGEYINLDGVTYFVSEVNIQDNGFKWYEVCTKDDHEMDLWHIQKGYGYRYKQSNFYGVIANGKVVVPCEYKHISYRVADAQDQGCFIAEYYDIVFDTSYYYLYNMAGIRLVPKRASGGDNPYLIKRYRDSETYEIINEIHTKYSTWFVDDNGAEVVNLAVVEPRECKDRNGNVYSYIVEGKNGYGVVNKQKKWIVSPQYQYMWCTILDDEIYYLCAVSKFIDTVLMDKDGKIIIPNEFDKITILGEKYIAFELNNIWGVMTPDKKVIIPLNRRYTKISYNKTLNTFFFAKEGFEGECNSQGVQTSITAVKKKAESTITPAKSTSSSSSQSSTSTSAKQREPQKRVTMVPMQVWQPCGGCNGSGQCSTCFGTGTNMSGNSWCISCHGNGKCHFCAGQGGQNVVQYVEKVEYY